LLAFTSVYFSESGLFKGLWPIQIKKLLSRLNSRPGLWAKRLKPLSLLTCHDAARPSLAAFLNAKHHSVDFCLVQEKVGKFWDYLGAVGERPRPHRVPVFTAQESAARSRGAILVTPKGAGREGSS
jgi:hypothetical protein